MLKAIGRALRPTTRTETAMAIVAPPIYLIGRAGAAAYTAVTSVHVTVDTRSHMSAPTADEYPPFAAE